MNNRLHSHVAASVSIFGFGHALIDAACAVVIFSSPGMRALSPETLFAIIILYNALAFAMQVPLGYLADMISKPELTAVVGCLLTAGAFLFTYNPLISICLAGIGNALFHIGGGIISINLQPGKAALPGIFIAPGALGVLLGTWIGKGVAGVEWIFVVLLSITAIGIILLKKTPAGQIAVQITDLPNRLVDHTINQLTDLQNYQPSDLSNNQPAAPAFVQATNHSNSNLVGQVTNHSNSNLVGHATNRSNSKLFGQITNRSNSKLVGQAANNANNKLVGQPTGLEFNQTALIRHERAIGKFEIIIFLLILSVVIRSFIGLSLAYPWNTGFTLPLIFTLAVFSGKAFGGILADRFGWMRISILGLLLSAPLLAFGAYVPILAILGIFFFNLTTPVTLVAIANILPRYAGFSLGLTTMAIFIGLIAAVTDLKNIVYAPLWPISLIVLSSAGVLFITFRLYYANMKNTEIKEVETELSC